MIRKPIVAGQFYPAERKALSQQINSFLEKTSRLKQKQKLKILILPHAGYDFSGPTAAWGVKQLENGIYRKIILLGVSHQAYFQQVAVWPKGAWQTPLGQIKIDQQLVNCLLKQTDFIQANPAAHQQEHSLEVILPFLQEVIQDFKIVPLLIGQATKKNSLQLAEALTKCFSEDSLLVVSSDLSHYPPGSIAQKVDRQTIESILTGKVQHLDEALEKGQQRPEVATAACGGLAIRTALAIAEKLKIKKVSLLDYSNSGNRGGGQNRVVGYAAIGFYQKSPKLLNQNQKKKLLRIARKTLKSYLKNKKIPEIAVNDEALKQKLGIFVTLRKKGQLRGCLGQLKSQQPLYQLVQKEILAASLNDPRFPKVKYQELIDIQIEISVLSPLKKAADWRKIKLGKEGVMVKRGWHQGVFLPQVAQETGWDLETFLANLCRHKAGLGPNCYQEPQTNLFTFTVQILQEEKK